MNLVFIMFKGKIKVATPEKAHAFTQPVLSVQCQHNWPMQWSTTQYVRIKQMISDKKVLKSQVYSKVTFDPWITKNYILSQILEEKKKTNFRTPPPGQLKLHSWSSLQKALNGLPQLLTARKYGLDMTRPEKLPYRRKLFFFLPISHRKFQIKVYSFVACSFQT